MKYIVLINSLTNEEKFKWILPSWSTLSTNLDIDIRHENESTHSSVGKKKKMKVQNLFFTYFSQFVYQAAAINALGVEMTPMFLQN